MGALTYSASGATTALAVIGLCALFHELLFLALANLHLQIYCLQVMEKLST